MLRTAITLKFKMCLFLDEASYWAETLLKDTNLPHLMPDVDNNFGDSLGLDFRKWWRHVQPKNCFVVVLRWAKIHELRTCLLYRLGWSSQTVYMRKSCLAYPGYPTCRGETTRLPELSRPPHVNDWYNFLNKWVEKYLAQGKLGGRVVSATRDHINRALVL